MSYGGTALKTFYDESRRLYPNSDLPKSFTTFLNLLVSGNSNDRGHRFLEKSLSNGIEIMYKEAPFWDYSVSGDVKDAMLTLAKKSKGQLPNSGAFVQALADEFSSLTLTPYYEKIEDVAVAFTNIGKGVLSTMNLSRYAIPVFALGGIGLFIYFKTKKFS